MTKDLAEVVKFSNGLTGLFPACAHWQADDNHRKRKSAAATTVGHAHMNLLPATLSNALVQA
jgi:hypothetical protein